MKNSSYRPWLRIPGMFSASGLLVSLILGVVVPARAFTQESTEFTNAYRARLMVQIGTEFDQEQARRLQEIDRQLDRLKALRQEVENRGANKTSLVQRRVEQLLTGVAPDLTRPSDPTLRSDTPVVDQPPLAAAKVSDSNLLAPSVETAPPLWDEDPFFRNILMSAELRYETTRQALELASKLRDEQTISDTELRRASAQEQFSRLAWERIRVLGDRRGPIDAQLLLTLLGQVNPQISPPGEGDPLFNRGFTPRSAQTTVASNDVDRLKHDLQLAEIELEGKRELAELYRRQLQNGAGNKDELSERIVIANADCRTAEVELRQLQTRLEKLQQDEAKSPQKAEAPGETPPAADTTRTTY